MQISGLALIFAAFGSKLLSTKNKLRFSYGIPNAMKQILLFVLGLYESHLSLASYWDAYYIIKSILYGAIKRNPVTLLKSTNEIHRHKTRVYHCQQRGQTAGINPVCGQF